MPNKSDSEQITPMKTTMLATLALWILASATSSRADYYDTRQTPNGWDVEVIVVTVDWTQNYADAIYQSTTNAYPNATVLSAATKYRNCHAYAWLSGQYVWLNAVDSMSTFQLSYFWDDGSHQYVWSTDGPTFTSNELQTLSGYFGEVLYYAASDHSALWVGGQNLVSKWGSGCLMGHTLDYCPYYPCTIDVFEEL